MGHLSGQLGLMEDLFDEAKSAVVPVAKRAFSGAVSTAPPMQAARNVLEIRDFINNLDQSRLDDTLGFFGAGLVAQGRAQAGLPPSPEIQDILRRGLPDQQPQVIENIAEPFKDELLRRYLDEPASAQIQNALQGYEQLRTYLEQQKQEAIRKAGAGAAAGYNAAIAKIDNEIAKLRLGLQNVDKLFANKAQNIAFVGDQTVEALQDISATPIENVEQIDLETKQRIQETFSDAQRQLYEFAKTIGADDPNSMAIAEEMQRIEDQIIEQDEIDSEFRKNIMRRAEDVAIATARASKSRTLLELKRKEIMLETKLKDQIDGLIEQRKVLVAQRASAVSAARRAAAAMFPDTLPFDPQTFGAFAASNFFDQAVSDFDPRNKNVATQFVSQLIQMGLSERDVYRMMNMRGDARAQFMLGLGFDQAGVEAFNQFYDGLSVEEQNVLKRAAPQTLATYWSGQDEYQKLLNADPFSMQPGSIEKMIALVGLGTRLGMSESEARAFATDESLLNATEPPSELRGLFR